MGKSPHDEILAAFELALDVQLRAVRRLRGRPAATRRRGPKGLSQVDMAFAVLRRAKTPLHVDDLIGEIARAHGVQPARDSLVSALSKKILAGDRFEKPAPNTFGLRADALG